MSASVESKESQPHFGTATFVSDVEPVVVYRCWIDLCVDEFSDKLGIIHHLQRNHGDKPELKDIEKKMRRPICMTCGASGSCEHKKKGGSHTEDRSGIVGSADVTNRRKKNSGMSHPRHQKCITCGKIFTSGDVLSRHRIDEHPGEKSFQCMFCTNTYDDNAQLMTHTRIHMGYRPYICVICGNRFPKNSDLRRHVRIHSGERPFKCAQCSQTFTQKCSLEKHAKIHARRSGGHPCLQCGLAFATTEELSEHSDSVHRDIQYKCSVCGKMYREERHLVAHEKRHDMVSKPHACSFCGRTFSLRALLLKHESRAHIFHEDVKCDQCGKSFKRKENLARHMLSHTGVKNFHCEICGIAFSEKGSLTRHTKSQHEQLRPFECTKCGRAFSRKSLLRRHFDAAHDKKENKDLPQAPVQYFRCKLCKKLLRTSGLRQHMRHHRRKGDKWEGNIEDQEMVVQKNDMFDEGSTYPDASLGGEEVEETEGEEDTGEMEGEEEEIEDTEREVEKL